VGMRYHIDPDQGVHWTTDTAVVSVGHTREFKLREIDDHSRRHRFFVGSGDVVWMFGTCQQDYQHCIQVCEQREEAGPRISLVFKQSLQPQ
jgi:alkylated DNA repair dioxygenase AlkB